MKTYDLIVVGGGISGVAAATAAAREGMSVLLIEQSGALGGAMSNSLVYPFMSYTVRVNGERHEISAGIFAEMKQRHADYVDASWETFKLVFDDMLSEAGVTISGTHSPLDDLRPTKLADTIAYHKAVGNPYYIIPGADLSTLAKIEDFANVVNNARPILAAEGIRLGYHNHSREFEIMPWGSTIHSELERRTDIDFEIDTYWAWNAGVDPIAVLERLGSRVKVIHVKDGFAGGKGKALGEGDAPVKAVVEYAKAKGITMVVESETLDPTGILEVGRCIDYLKSID